MKKKKQKQKKKKKKKKTKKQKTKNKKIYRNAKQFSIFFLSENCFENNCPNVLGIVLCFQKLFSKTVYQTLF